VLLEEGLVVTGGDISEAMLAVARQKCDSFGEQAAFRSLDLDSLDLSDRSFELVTCIRLFHHLKTLARAAVLKELARVSTRYVLVNVSFSSPYYRLRRSVKRQLGQGVSRASSTWSEITWEATAAGLRVACTRMVLPGVSEDMIVLLEKLQ
jgi:ubiquinone/menaquinone biosynthesis C-methylase UbiE